MGYTGNYIRGSDDIALEIERKGIILGIDWQNEAQVRALANEALTHLKDDTRLSQTNPLDFQARAKVELFGLTALMLKTMQQSANEGLVTHGNLAWKAFAKALWSENKHLPLAPSDLSRAAIHVDSA
jgi:uncharacterized protein YuzE